MTQFNFDNATKVEVRDLFCNEYVDGMFFVLKNKRYMIIEEESDSKARMCAPYWSSVYVVEDENGNKSEMNICEEIGILG